MKWGGEGSAEQTASGSLAPVLEPVVTVTVMLGPQARAAWPAEASDYLTCGLTGQHSWDLGSQSPRGWLRPSEKALATEPRRRGCLEPLLLAAVSLGPWAFPVSDPWPSQAL